MSLFWSEKPVRLQGARLLRRRRHRHGAVLGPARGRGPRRRSAIRRRGSGGCRRRRCGRTGSAPRGRSACCSPATRSTAATAVEWGLATEAAPAAELDAALRGAARARRAAADQPAGDAQAARQPGGRLAGARRDPGRSARSSTGSPATRPRATSSSAARPRPGSSRRCASATSRSATSASAQGGMRREGPDHQLADAVRARHGAPARRRRARGLRRRRLRAVARAATRSTSRGTSSTLGARPRPRRSSTSSSGSSASRDRRRRAGVRGGLLHLDPARAALAVGDDLRRPVRGARAPARQGGVRGPGPRASACRSPRPSSPPPTPSSPRRSGASTATSPAPCSRAAASPC